MIPGEVFRYVPHPDPLVLFDTPIPVEGEDETEQLLGFFISGVTEAGVFAPSDAPQMAGLAITYCWLHPDRTPDTQLVTGGGYELDITLDRTPEEMIADLDQLDAAIPKAETIGGNYTRRPAKSSPQALTVSLAVLLYLCSSEPDLQQHPITSRSRKARRAQSKQPDTWGVGWRAGATLRAHRHDNRADGDTPSCTGPSGPTCAEPTRTPTAPAPAERANHQMDHPDPGRRRSTQRLTRTGHQRQRITETRR